MRRRTNTVWILAILTVLLATGTMLVTAAAQKSSVPKVHDFLIMGEEHVKQLLPLMNANKQGMVSKQEYMRFMEAEFDRLDKEKKGELNVKKLTQSELSASRFAGK
jgi:sulfatase maturation enzyme AslB (radical SAM superfamily)